MEQITVTKKEGGEIKLISKEPFRAITSISQESSLMSDDYVKISLKSSDSLHFSIGDKIRIGSDEYSIRTNNTTEIVHDESFNYDLTFYGVMYDLIKTIYRNCDIQGNSTTAAFDLTYTLKDFINVLVYNTGRDYPGIWLFDAESCPSTDTKTISFSNQNCLQVLQSLCSATNFDCDFRITQKDGVRTIHVGKFGSIVTPPNNADYFECGKGKGLYKLKEDKVDDKSIITRLYVEGGSTNVRSEYRDYAGKLQLPYPQRNNTREHTLSDGTVITTGSKIIGITDDTKRYFEDVDLENEIGSIEDAIKTDDIFPCRTGKVTALGADVYSFIDDTMGFDLNEKDSNGTKWLIADTTAKITFASGYLAGQQFELKKSGGYVHGTKTFSLIKYTDERGMSFPSETSESFQIHIGDTYKITDINLPTSYEDDAEEDLWFYGYDKFLQAKQPRAQYTATFTEDFFINHFADSVTDFFKVGDYLPIKDTRFGIEKNIRITKITRNLLKDYDYTITLSDTTTISVTNQIVSDVISHSIIINKYGLKDVTKARRGWRTTEDLRNLVFDTDGYFDGTNIKPNSIDTNMLAVGSKSQQFVLVSVTLQANVNGLPNRFDASSGILAHFTIDEDNIKTWNLTANSVTLPENGAYYVYAKCSKSGATGTYYIAQEQLKFEPTADVDNYYFLIGIIGSLNIIDNYRDFTTTYGFTRINGRTITTGRIVSSDGNCYLDLDENVFSIGDSNNALKWDGGKLYVKGLLVQNQGGDTDVIGLYRGVYNSTYNYYKGDEVTYTDNGTISTYRYIYPTSTKGSLPTNILYWQIIAQGTKGADGISPNTAYKSTVFRRTNNIPTGPTDGSYSNPIPSGWSDGIPSGESKLWATTRIFSSDGLSPQQSYWTPPQQMTDTADFDVEFSSVENPNAPTGHPNTNTQWSNIADTNTIWMSTSKNNNGVWGDWQVSKIKGEKGEKGEDGTSIKIKGTKNNISELPTSPTDASDCYIVGNNLYVWDGDSWENAGQFKGEDGLSAYVHVKYANSLITNDWTANNGETPGAYIGIYTDNSLTDQLTWSLYTWAKWKGEDGFGYEYIYKRTVDNIVPTIPAIVNQNDGYVPDGWTANPTGVSDDFPFEWVAIRTKTNGTWGTFTVPTIWTTYMQQSNPNLLSQTEFESWEKTNKWEKSHYTTKSGYTFSSNEKPTLTEETGYSYLYIAAANSPATPTTSNYISNGWSTSKVSPSIEKPYVYYTRRATSGTIFSSPLLCLTLLSTSNGWIMDGAQGHKAFYNVNGYTTDKVDYMTMLKQPLNGLEVSSWYALSFFAKGNGVEAVISSLDASVGTYIDGEYTLSVGSDGLAKWVLTSNWVRHTFVFKTLSSVTNASLEFRLSYENAYICMPKLERGRMITPYIPKTTDLYVPYYEYRYAKSGSTTTPPSLVVTDTEPAGWATAQPKAGILEYIWQTVSEKNSDGTLLTNWTTPIRITPKDGEDGQDGSSPVMAYRGVYDPSKTYYGNSLRVDAVKYNSIYYIARIDAGPFIGIPPTDGSCWNTFGTQFDSVATNLLLAEGANIGDWYISGGKIVSTMGSGNKMTLDATKPAITIESASDGSDYALNRDIGAVLQIDGDNGSVSVKAKTAPSYSNSIAYLSTNGIFANLAGTNALPASSGYTHRGAIVGLGFANVNGSTWDSYNQTIVAGVYGRALNSGTAPAFGGYFENLMASGMFLYRRAVTDTDGVVYLNDTDSLIVGYNSNTKNVYLPTSTKQGQQIIALQWCGGEMHLYPRGGQKLYHGTSIVDYFTIVPGEVCFCFFVIGYISSTKTEAWVCSSFKTGA